MEKSLKENNMETLFLHKENPNETNRNAKGKGCKKNTIQKPYCGRRDRSLWLKHRSQSLYFSEDATPREQECPPAGERMEVPEEGPGVPGREGGTKEGMEQTHKGGQPGTRSHETGRITNGRICFGDNIIRNSLGRGALCLTKRSHCLLQREVPRAGLREVRQQFQISSSIKRSPLSPSPHQRQAPLKSESVQSKITTLHKVLRASLARDKRVTK